ncbi:MAG: class IV adenylate cyclase [Bacteroidales bacterium]|nr:class IV adenylate cyclase [Bacteroidales bacterium]
MNIEIKAYCSDPQFIETILHEKNAEFVGTDHQVDTYFNCSKGRLKLREGNIENALIQYNRDNIAGPKKSDVLLYKTKPGSGLKEILSKSIGIRVIVNKERKIFFIDNIKFHIDKVKGLGSFIEIEAIDKTGKMDQTKLFEQCQRYLTKFGIRETDLIDVSYSDLLIQKNT